MLAVMLSRRIRTSCEPRKNLSYVVTGSTGPGSTRREVGIGERLGQELADRVAGGGERRGVGRDPVEDLLGHRGEPPVAVADRQLAEVGQVLPDVLDAGLVLAARLHRLDLAVGLQPVEGQLEIAPDVAPAAAACRPTGRWSTSERLVTSEA